MIGSTITTTTLLSYIQRFSSEIHVLNFRSSAFLTVLNAFSDQQLIAILTAGGSNDAPADCAEIRLWQAALQNIVNNYTGEGTLADNSAEICPRASVG